MCDASYEMRMMKCDCWISMLANSVHFYLLSLSQVIAVDQRETWIAFLAL